MTKHTKPPRVPPDWDVAQHFASVIAGEANPFVTVATLDDNKDRKAASLNSTTYGKLSNKTFRNRAS